MCAGCAIPFMSTRPKLITYVDAAVASMTKHPIVSGCCPQSGNRALPEMKQIHNLAPNVSVGMVRFPLAIEGISENPTPATA
jgi:hypothetical protein